MGPQGWGYGGGWGKRGEWVTLWTLIMVAEGPVHGYEILMRLKEAGISLNPGSLYRTLRALEAQGVVESRWTMGGGPARRLYRLTTQGWAYLRELRRLLQEQRRVLEEVMERIDKLENRGR